MSQNNYFSLLRRCSNGGDALNGLHKGKASRNIAGLQPKGIVEGLKKVRDNLQNIWQSLQRDGRSPGGYFLSSM